MTLYKLKTSSLILIEDDLNTNILPLLCELCNRKDRKLNVFCYEKPSCLWSKLFKDMNVVCHVDIRTWVLNKDEKYTVLIDSVNQMVLCLGWTVFLAQLKKLKSHPNIQTILVLHKDCLYSSKLQVYLNHLATAIISYSDIDLIKIAVIIKRRGKISKSEEIIEYDTTTKNVKLKPILKEDKKQFETEKPCPANLSTFKIEVEQSQQYEKAKLKLPYMNKINEGQSQIYYEPDAVDDWDDEDPDEDLDI